MPRRPREEAAGAIHHVYDRGNNRQTIFHDDLDVEVYLLRMGLVCEATKWNCLAYCLLDNHFHLLIETPRPNLGTGMQRLLSPYVQTFHARHGSQDALFGRRYGNTRIKDDVHLWTALSYLVMNPVTAGLCRTPEEWRWGSHALMVNGGAPEWLAVDRLLEFFGAFGGRPERVYHDLIRGSLAAHQAR